MTIGVDKNIDKAVEVIKLFINTLYTNVWFCYGGLSTLFMQYKVK